MDNDKLKHSNSSSIAYEIIDEIASMASYCGRISWLQTKASFLETVVWIVDRICYVFGYITSKRCCRSELDV